jgi:hypothetical protein
MKLIRNSYSSEIWIYQAEQRLDESHKEAVSRVMRDWTELETKYLDIKAQVINIFVRTVEQNSNRVTTQDGNIIVFT